MARDKEYSVVNLLIHYVPAGELEEPDSDRLHGRTQKAIYSFLNEQQLIDYLSEGKAPESVGEETGDQIKMLVLEPTDKAGTIAFPPVD